MANVKFNLKSKKEAETLVLLIFRYNGNKLVYSTGEKINPSYWSDEQNEAKKTAKFSQYPEFNAYLKHLETITQNIYRKYRIEGKELDNDTFKEELNIALGKTDKGEIPGFLKFIEVFIEEREKMGKPKGSIQVYNKVLKHLKDFESEYSKIDYNDIDLVFLEKFKHFLFSEPRSLSNNYARKILQNVKMFLNEAKELGYHDNSAYLSKKFTIKKEEINHIYLNEEELELLYNLDLSNTPRLDRVRDSFLVGAYSGLRFSDYNKLEPKHFKKINGKDMIEIITTKTKQKLLIPVNSKVKSIIEKYSGRLPSLSNQKLNSYLKELGEIAGIDEPITTVKTKGFAKVEETCKKYELLSSHCARRSFATNAFKAGIPILAIRSITGHSTEASFLTYISCNQEETALLMANNPFFS